MRESAPSQAIRFIAITLCGLLFLLPLWWVAVSALRPEEDIFRYISELSVWTFLPRNSTFAHLIEVWQSPFARAILNSIVLAAATVIFGLIVCATAAFALATIEFRGRNLVFSMMVVSFLIPFDSIALPLYTMMRTADLQNTFFGLVLPGIGNGLAVFLLRQFFLGLPRELREAGMVDGLGWFGVFVRIYLPLSGNALIGAAMILFIFQWQSYLWPLLIAPAPDLKVASVAIAEFSTMYQVSYQLVFAAALFISIIPMAILCLAQRYFNVLIASPGSKE